jgi:hypothetical protein
MFNQKLAAARAIKGDLLPAEASIDRALGHLGQLIATACKSRLEADLPVHIGQEAMRHLTTATAMMGELRGLMVSAHTCLAQDGRRILPATSVGDVGDCPAQARAGTPEPGAALRAVA